MDFHEFPNKHFQNVMNPPSDNQTKALPAESTAPLLIW
jgi:hypothetical protein